MGLQTPEKIRTLQRKLYLKAKSEPEFRFYMLYDKIYREDILNHAYRLAKANGGSPGTDGVSFDQIESEGVAKWLTGIREQLRDKIYRPQPVRRVMIPKPGGGERPLGIPTIRDRAVQTATKLVIAPIFEADLEPNVYGYRPKRSALNAIQQVIADKGYDSDPLRQRLKHLKIDMIVPHRRNRTKNKKQDGRKLRRYRKRWKVECTFAWLGNFRRLVVRYERHIKMYQAFFHLACLIIVLNRF